MQSQELKAPCPKPKKLYRTQDYRVIAGVAGGLGEYYQIDPNWFRLIFVLLGLLFGLGIVIYLILWILLPLKSKISQPESKTIQSNVGDIAGKTQKATQDVRTKGESATKIWLSIVIILFGVIIILVAGGLGLVNLFGLNSIVLLLIVFLAALLAFLVS